MGSGFRYCDECSKKRYIGGLNTLTGRDFLRECVRIRDNHTCQECRKIWEKGKRRLDVHHLDPKKESSREYELSKCFDEMVTLCHKCHLNLHSVREKMSKPRKKIRMGVDNSIDKTIETNGGWP